MEDEEGYGHYDEDEDDVFDDEEDPDPQYMFPRHVSKLLYVLVIS